MRCDESSRLICLLMMPRVVPDQRRKFETEELFVTLSRVTEVRYTGMPAGTDDERKARFQQDCHDGRIELACIPSGFNLDLYVSPSSRQVPSTVELGGGMSSRDCIEFGPDRAKVQIRCHFILNGVCVQWRGWIDPNTLRGQGCVEFDEEGARLEDQRLRQELRNIEERLRYLEQHQPYMRGLTIPTIPAELFRDAPPPGHHPGSSYHLNHGAPITSSSDRHRGSLSPQSSSPETT